MKYRLLLQLLESQRDKRPVVLLTRLADGQQRLAYPDTEQLPEFGASVLAAARQALINDRSGQQDGVFIQVFNPPLRLILIGAVHIAQALIPMARLCGYEPTVVEPRAAWSEGERMPGVNLCTEWPDVALQQLAIDKRTAVVSLSHDPKLDDPALRIALGSPAFYVGALGSRRTHAARIERLLAEGLTRAAIDRLHAPVGLAIGADSPAEIALSILAQMTLVRHGG